jgi:hypothetical protein
VLLDKQEPMKVGLRKLKVCFRIHGKSRANVKEDGFDHTGRVVHKELMGNACAPVVRANIEFVVSYPAALSRIHLKLKYDDLKSKAMRKIWANLLGRAQTSDGPVDISTNELESLSKTHLNGREVRSLTADP